MLKLMRLEMQKFKMGRYIRGAFIASFVIFALLCFLALAEKSEGTVAFPTYADAFMIIDTMVRGTFIVFAATLIARIVIGEYKNKTITLLFMYPVNRRKIIVSKLVIVVLFTFAAIVYTDIMVSCAFYLFDRFANVVPEKLSSGIVSETAISMGMNALAASFMGLIPLFFGMRKLSVSTTIVSSLGVVLLVCSGTNEFSLNSIIAIPISLAALGIVIAYLAIRKVEHADVAA
ncbi:ABC transporter permease [Cohnella panacarvi]|uniref:ABC transporter permease n=1 Tax=Cohnella panacarvi TaxID=400776 RepID=UPI00047E34FF|nr:ABC transporter permease [Cohnella panacarvi]